MKLSKRINETSQGACDTEQLDEIIASLNSLQCDVSIVMSEVSMIRGDITHVNQTLNTHLNMLSTLVNQNHKSPIMFIVLPAKSSFFSSFKGIFMKEMIISFICPVTKKPVKSGKNGKGYRLKLPTALVKVVAPMVAITFAIVGVALLAYGIPLPTPPLPKNMKSQDLINSMLNEMAVVVAEKALEGAAEEEEHAEVMECVNEAIESCKAGGTLSNMAKRRMAVTM